jgi:hypothetical protein
LLRVVGLEAEEGIESPNLVTLPNTHLLLSGTGYLHGVSAGMMAGGYYELPDRRLPTRGDQLAAQQFFQGMHAVDPEVQQWILVPGDAKEFPLEGAVPVDVARVNGPMGIVACTTSDPRVAKSGWSIVSVAGPEHCLVRVVRV